MAPRAPRLLLITATRTSPEVLAPLLPELSASVDLLLLRWPEIPARELFERSRRLASQPVRPALAVSDRFDVALSAGLEGVHLRESSVDPQSVRARAPQLWVGASRHRDTIGTREDGADYLTLSPARPTRSKPGDAGIGWERFGALVDRSSRPVLALGGVDAEHVAPAVGAGAWGIAVCSAVWQAQDPVGAAVRLRTALDRALRAAAVARSADDRRDG